MNVIIYPDPTNPAPSRIQIVYAGGDTLEQYAFKYLEPYNIEYLIVDQATIPAAGQIYFAQTLEISGGFPVYGYDLSFAKDIASGVNASYFQAQYNNGLLGLSITNDYQLNLAIATPEAERTADQVAAVEFMIGINGLQTSVQEQIDTATTGEQLITILNQLG